MAAYISGSVMNNSVSHNIIIEYSKQNELYRYWPDLPLLVHVCCTVRKYILVLF